MLGLGLAILLDQKIRAEGLLRPIYLYPMALSFIVTGTAWKWFLDPGIGLENTMHLWGWESFAFNWIKDRNYAIYCVVIAAVWQSSGFVMAMFLAGLRGVDNEIIKAAQIDGATTGTIYRRIIIPLMRPVFLSAFVVLAHLAIKAYDLVVALTGGGPGQSLTYIKRKINVYEVLDEEGLRRQKELSELAVREYEESGKLTGKTLNEKVIAYETDIAEHVIDE